MVWRRRPRQAVLLRTANRADDTARALLRILRSKLVAPAVVLLLTVGAITAVWLLSDQAGTSSNAQFEVASMKLALADLQSAPFNADPDAGGSPSRSRRRIEADEVSLARGLTSDAQADVPPRLLARGRANLAEIDSVVVTIYQLALEKGGLTAAGGSVAKLQEFLTTRSAAFSSVLDQISRVDATRSARGHTQVKVGTTAAMLLLLAVFAYFYFRSIVARGVVERLVREKESLLGESQFEARTDSLTGLGNRRALASDLAQAIIEPIGPHELLLAMFDLDGFKQYNDSFGHAAGDALLQRLGGSLAVAVDSLGSAYRLGGDEFCLLARCSHDAAEGLIAAASDALQDGGEGWHVGCSHGAVWVPSEATSESQALILADERMYGNKTTRSSASRQVTDALLQVITEQNAFLDEHVERVAELAGAVAEALGQSDHEVWRVRLAARLHDVGKTAIPAGILAKPGPLDEGEWEFMHRHPLIGERIVLAAPALAGTAPLIRSSHERVDGRGYPDGLVGDDIPLGARIIAVCDAFDAMTSERPYRAPMEVGAALEELRQHVNTQFDGTVVDAFCSAVALDSIRP
jgi:diguanylate cyclase (GGDEF)-like protein